MFKKLVLIYVLVLFLWFLRFYVGFAENNSSESTIRVPTNYQTIQEAINAASPRDTILVASGVYEENVVVNKSLRFVGEAVGTTIVDGGGYDWENVTRGFFVISDNVSIENFTVRNAFQGIHAENIENITIQNNVLMLNLCGIKLNSSCQATIQNNIAMNNTYGIYLENSLNCIIENNTAINNYGGHPDLRIGGGIIFGKSNDSKVIDNYITKNLVGICLGESCNNTIIQNLVVENREPVYGGGSGIEIGSSDENIIANNTLTPDCINVIDSNRNIIRGNFVQKGGIGTGGGFSNVFCENVVSGCLIGFTMEKACDFFVGNLIINNTSGINIHFSNDSTFYHNILINNTVHVPKDVYSNVNAWDNGFEGNYWSNYTGVDSDHDAVGDTPHVLDELNTDRYPLMAPINIFDAGTWNDTQQQIHVISNSTVTNFQLNKIQTTLSFNVTGETGLGFCRITIPNVIIQDMWQDNYTVLINDEEPLWIKNWTDDTNTYIYFTYQHSERQVTIIPEFPLNMLLPLLMLATVPFILLKKKLKH